MANQFMDALASSAGDNSGDNSFIGPESAPNNDSGTRAPNGTNIGNDLPVVAAHGGPGWTEGFSPEPGNPPLPPPGSNEGSGLPPSGNRR